MGGNIDQEDSDDQALARFATIIGFIAMLRPHVFDALRPSSFTLVTYTGQCFRMSNTPSIFRKELWTTRRVGGILGFLVDFRSKTMVNARAYLPSLSTTSHNSNIATICPVRALIQIVERGLVKGTFLRKTKQKKQLSKYLQHITGSTSPISPYALRIGGRT